MSIVNSINENKLKALVVLERERGGRKYLDKSWSVDCNSWMFCRQGGHTVWRVWKSSSRNHLQGSGDRPEPAEVLGAAGPHGQAAHLQPHGSGLDLRRSSSHFTHDPHGAAGDPRVWRPVNTKPTSVWRSEFTSTNNNLQLYSTEVQPRGSTPGVKITSALRAADSFNIYLQTPTNILVDHLRPREVCSRYNNTFKNKHKKLIF